MGFVRGSASDQSINMRWMLAACLINATFAVPRQEVGGSGCVDKPFRDGLQHTFHYDSHLLTGLPTANDQYSGFKISAETKFQFLQHPDVVDALKVVLRLQNLRIYKVHGSLGEQNLPSNPLLDHLEAMHLIHPNSPEGQVLIKHLSKTCVFDFQKGQVTSLRVHKDEPNWSINFKKGIVNMLKVNVHSSKSAYTVTDEDDILGKCDSVYTLNSYNSYVQLTKKRYLDTCTERPQFETGFIAGLKTYDGSKKSLDTMVQADYVLYRESDHQFAIKEAQLKSSYVFRPYLKESDSIVTYIWQKLSCMEVTEVRSTDKSIEGLTLVKDLKFDMPNTELASKFKRKSRPFETVYKNSEETLRTVDDKLSSIVQKMQTSFVQDNVPVDILRVTKLMRFLSARDILSLLRTYNTRDIFAQSKLQLLLDIVPSLSTEAANEVVITIVKEKIVTGLPASLMINLMTLTAQPTPELIDQFLQLYKLKMQQNDEDQLLLRSLMLSVGSLANRMIEQHNTSRVDRQTTVSMLRGFVQEIRSMIQTSRSEEEQLRLIKTIGNFGEPSFFSELKTIIEDEQLSADVREEAMEALSKFCWMPEIKQQVMGVIMPLFMNNKEETRLRTVAFSIILKTQPSYHTLEMIAHHVEREPNHQMKTYVYSTYLELSKCQSNEPHLHETTVNVRRCLKWIKPVMIMPWDTQHKHTEIYPDVLRMGAHVDNILIKSRHSILPQSFTTLVKSTLFGKYLDLFQADVTVDGMELLLKRIISWLRTDGDKTISSIVRMLSSDQEMVQGSLISRKIESLLRQLPVGEMEDSEFNAMAYIKVLGHEIQFIYFNKQDLLNLMSQTQDMYSFMRIFMKGQQFRWNKVVSLVDNNLVLPSPIGLPVTLNFTNVNIISMTTDLRFEGFQSLIRSFVSGGELSFDTLKMKFKTDISTPIYTVFSMGSNLAAIESGFSTSVNIVTNIPIDAEVSFDSNTGRLIFKNTIPEEKVDLLEMKIQPFTYFTKIPIDSSAIAQIYNKDVEILPLRKPSVDIPVNSQYSVPLLLLPIKLDVQSKTVFGNPAWSAQFPLMGEQHISVMLNKQSVHVPSFVMQIDVNQIPEIFYCNQDTGNYRSGRDSFYGYTTLDLGTVRLDESFTRKCKAIQIPIKMTSDDNSNRKIQVLLTYIRSPDWMMHQFNTKIVGESLYGLNHGLDNIRALTDIVIDLEKITQEGFYRDPIVKVTFAFGINNIDDNKIVIKVLKDAPEHIFESEYNSHTDNTKTYKYTVQVKYNLVPVVQAHLEKCKYTILPYIQDYLSEIDTGSKLLSSVGEIKCYVKIIPQWEKVSVVFELPTGEKYMMNLLTRLPYLTPLTLNHPISLVEPPYHHNMSHMTKMLNFGKCEITKTTLVTYDRHILEIPSVLQKNTCSMLMTRDCSRLHEHNDFAVFVKPTDRTGFKSIQVLVPEYEIEVTPVVQKHWFSWRKTADLEVRVNGEHVEVNSFSQEPVVLYAQQGLRKPLYQISEINNVVEIKCVQLGVTVYSDGNFVNVKTSPWYQGQLCGLCGNYNMDPTDDMKQLEATHVASQQSYFARFVIPSSECPIQGL